MTVTTQAPHLVALTEEEWRLVRGVRELPDSPLRDRLVPVMRDLVDFVANPGCPESQADGVPCASAQAACERCRQVTQFLDGLRIRLRHA